MGFVMGFNDDLPSGDVRIAIENIENGTCGSLIYPLIAWWFCSSLCKRLPEGNNKWLLVNHGQDNGW